MNIKKTVILICFMSLMLLTHGVANAGTICIAQSAGGYTYELEYTAHGDKYDINGFIIGYDIPCSGSALSTSDGIIIGIVCSWAPASSYLDPVSHVIMNLRSLTDETHYIPTGPVRTYPHTITIVPCPSAKMEESASGDNH
jgi:hypothetical protein